MFPVAGLLLNPPPPNLSTFFSFPFRVWFLLLDAASSCCCLNTDDGIREFLIRVWFLLVGGKSNIGYLFEGNREKKYRKGLCEVRCVGNSFVEKGIRSEGREIETIGGMSWPKTNKIIDIAKVGSLILFFCCYVAIIQFNLVSVKVVPAPCFRAFLSLPSLFLASFSRNHRRETSLNFFLFLLRCLSTIVREGKRFFPCLSRRKSLFPRRKSLSRSCVTKNISLLVSINHFNNYPTNIIFIVFLSVALILQRVRKKGAGGGREVLERHEGENYVFFLMNVIKDNFEPLFHNWHFRRVRVKSHLRTRRWRRDCEVIWGIDLILTATVIYSTTEAYWIIWPSKATVDDERRLALVEFFSSAGEESNPQSFSSSSLCFSSVYCLIRHVSVAIALPPPFAARQMLHTIRDCLVYSLFSASSTEHSSSSYKFRSCTSANKKEKFPTTSEAKEEFNLNKLPQHDCFAFASARFVAFGLRFRFSYRFPWELFEAYRSGAVVFSFVCDLKAEALPRIVPMTMAWDTFCRPFHFVTWCWSIVFWMEN